MGLLDEVEADYAQKRLIAALERYGWRVGTGFLSTPLILYVLTDMDIECAYRLLENEEIPGWLSMPKHGATTIWEDWEGPYGSQSGIASLNHYSKGAVCEWLFTTMCGIQVERENRFAIAPRRALHPRGLVLRQHIWYSGEQVGAEGRQDGLYDYDPRQLHGAGQAALRRRENRGGGRPHL